jgi:hypothetical protein
MGEKKFASSPFPPLPLQPSTNLQKYDQIFWAIKNIKSTLLYLYVYLFRVR